PGHAHPEARARGGDVRLGAADLNVQRARRLEAGRRRDGEPQQHLAERDEVVRDAWLRSAWSDDAWPRPAWPDDTWLHYAWPRKRIVIDVPRMSEAVMLPGRERGRRWTGRGVAPSPPTENGWGRALAPP